MMTSHDFGPRLKATRERRGITLESISESSKIGLPLLEGLERSDASHWPKGIFRRAFFRDYATAIGVPVDDMLAEFLRLFPEDGHAVIDTSPAALRMTLAVIEQPPMRLRAMRSAAALAEAAIVALLGLVAGWVLGVTLGVGVAMTALLYYPLTSGWFGRSLVLSRLHDNRSAERAWRTAPVRPVEATPATAAPSESVREEWRAAGSQRDRRTGHDRRRATRLLHDADTSPIAGVFGMRKGSAA
jgi:transcriptional regulator with XRE-family HTH domain